MEVSCARPEEPGHALFQEERPQHREALLRRRTVRRREGRRKMNKERKTRVKMTPQKKRTRKPAKGKTTKVAATPTRRRRKSGDMPAGAVKRWGLRLAPEAAQAVDAEADKQEASGSAVIAGVLREWAEARAPDATKREETLEEFAARVIATARRMPNDSQTGQESRGARFGEHRVFIRAVFDEMAREPGAQTWEAFIARLLEANRARMLSLSRADLVEAMHPRDVAESRITYFGSEFNFVVV
jgi:hypothetical protein